MSEVARRPCVNPNGHMPMNLPPDLAPGLIEYDCPKCGGVLRFDYYKTGAAASEERLKGQNTGRGRLRAAMSE